MSVAFLSGAIFPVILHGLSLFFATFLPLIVFATGPFIIHLAALTTLVTANLLVGL